jgi:hypothetical protein
VIEFAEELHPPRRTFDEMIRRARREHQHQTRAVDQERFLFEEIRAAEDEQDDQADECRKRGKKVRQPVDGFARARGDGVDHF